jgi:hypothetical protein
MEFINIQTIGNDICNFDITNININERIMLDSYLKGKIKNKNDFFENLLYNEKKYSNKYMEYLLYYLINNEYDTKTIKGFIKKIKNCNQMTNEYIGKNKIFSNIDEIYLTEEIEKVLKYLSIKVSDDDEREIIYLYNIDYKKILDIFILGYHIDYNLDFFLEMLMKPMFHMRYRTNNIINELLKYILNNKEITKNIKDYSINQILKFLELKL